MYALVRNTTGAAAAYTTASVRSAASHANSPSFALCASGRGRRPLPAWAASFSLSSPKGRPVATLLPRQTLLLLQAPAGRAFHSSSTSSASSASSSSPHSPLPHEQHQQQERQSSASSPSPPKQSTDVLKIGRRLIATPGRWSNSTIPGHQNRTYNSNYQKPPANTLYSSPGAQTARAAAANTTGTNRISSQHNNNNNNNKGTASAVTPTTKLTPSGQPFLRDSMHSTSEKFEAQKPQIIDRLRSSLFVSFDLEFSGIGKPKDGSRPPFRVKQTLQEAYEGMKEGVERYQILQLGLCPVEWDSQKAEYIASPVNIYVSPIVPNQNLNVDRVFSLQGSALEFLLDHGFDFNKQLRHGVPYLSREEERRIRETQNAEDEGRREMAPIEPSAQEFANDCIKALEEWEQDSDPAWDFLNISSTNNVLTSYQRLIVHQIVRTRFPNLTTTTRGSFICVTRITPELQAKRQAEFEAQLDQAIGVRHIIDEMFSPKREDGRKLVLVGHNCFIDLLHLYHCFIGPLPEKVEEFAEIVNTCFPIVIDTKYLATHNNHTSNANSNSTLQLLWTTLSQKLHPRISCHTDYSIYSDGQISYHEAGYDALLTAQILLRLAGELSDPAAGGGRVPDFYELGGGGDGVADVARREVGKGEGKGIGEEGVEGWPVKRQKLDSEVVARDGGLRSAGRVVVERFWRRYVNRLRVFVTEAGELVLRQREGGAGSGV